MSNINNIAEVAAKYMRDNYGDAIRTFGPKHVQEAHEDGYTAALSTMPEWNEIEPNKEYNGFYVYRKKRTLYILIWGNTMAHIY